MHNKYFEILPSNILRYWIISIHMLACLVILFLPLDYLLTIGFSGLIALSYFFSENKKCIIKSFEYDKNNVWKLYTAEGERISAKLLKRNYISDFLLILRFELTEPVILFRTQLTPQAWRHLQMIIRN